MTPRITVQKLREVKRITGTFKYVAASDCHSSGRRTDKAQQIEAPHLLLLLTAPQLAVGVRRPARNDTAAILRRMQLR